MSYDPCEDEPPGLFRCDFCGVEAHVVTNHRDDWLALEELGWRDYGQYVTSKRHRCPECVAKVKKQWGLKEALAQPIGKPRIVGG